MVILFWVISFLHACTNLAVVPTYWWDHTGSLLDKSVIVYFFWSPNLPFSLLQWHFQQECTPEGKQISN